MKQTNILFVPEIPDSWKLIPNRYLFYKDSEKVGDKSNQYQLLSLTTEGVKEKDINSTGGKVPTSYDNYQTVEKNDMIFCLFDLDCSAVFSGMSKYNGMITSAYDVLKTNPNYIIADYIQYWFSYIFSNRYYKMYSKNIRYSVTMDVFNAIETPLPSLEEQSKIASFLDEKCSEIDSLISLQDDMIVKLQEYKKSLITESVTRGLDPSIPMKDSGVYYLGNINLNWTIRRMRYVCSKLKRNFNESAKPLLCTNKGKVTFRPDTMVGRMVSEDHAMQGINKGDIAIHGMDTWHGAVALSDYDGKITRVVHVCDSTEDNRFVVYYLQYLAFHGVYKLISNGVRENTSDFRSWDKVADIKICLPPIDEQHDIADFLDRRCSEIDSLIDIKKQKIEAFKEYKKSLIYECVTGKKEIA